MANPNMASATTFLGKTEVKYPTSSSAHVLLNNPSGSGKILKVNFLYFYTQTSGSYTISVHYYNQDDMGGTSFLMYSGSVGNNQRRDILDYNSGIFYLLEDKSIGFTSSNNSVVFFASYEEIS